MVYPHGAFPWCPHGVSMVSLWCLLGASIAVPRCLHGTSAVSLWWVLSWCPHHRWPRPTALEQCTLEETLDSVASRTRCRQPLISVRLMVYYTIVECFHGVVFTPTLCRGAGVPVTFDGNTMVPSWCFRGIAMVSQWGLHGAPMVLPWCLCGACVVPQLRLRGASVVKPWRFHGFSMVSPLCLHCACGDTMVRLLCFHVVRMASPWCLSVLSPW